MLLLSAGAAAQADVAAYSTGPISLWSKSAITDPAGLKADADAVGHRVGRYPIGWDALASTAEHLAVVNGTGVNF